MFDYPNEVDNEYVTYMINNFSEDVWIPIVVNQDYFLLDGQHRLRLAVRTGFKYIDVIMKKKKAPEISKKMREQFKRECDYQKEVEKILGFAI